MTREDVRAALTDRSAAVATIYGEARGELIEGLIAVACVIRTRARNPRWWGRDVRGVCLASKQFSCWWEDGPNAASTYAVAEAMMRGEGVGARTVLSEIAWVVEGVLGDQLRDVTGGADHYLTTALFRSPRAPFWARGKTPTAVVGAHTFLRLEV